MDLPKLTRNWYWEVSGLKLVCTELPDKDLGFGFDREFNFEDLGEAAGMLLDHAKAMGRYPHWPVNDGMSQ